MKATISDVAKQAGVSIKTVSRVINKEPSVRDNTREKVEKAIAELKYQPNPSARRLAGIKFEIGFVYDNPNAYYIIEMQNGILEECRNQGYELLIHPCNSKSANIVEELTSVVKNSQLAGLILTPPLSEMVSVIFGLKQAEVPFVRIISGSKAPDNLSPCIYIDDRMAAYSITKHLLELGHTDIGFICGETDHKSTGERLEGYKDALSEQGLAVNKNLIIDGQYSFESGVSGAKQLLALDKVPTAIFACNDEIAAGALFASRLMDVDIPGQLSIVGFEDSPFSRQTWPKLTTAAQPTNTIACKATSILIEEIRHNKEGNPPKSERFEPQLVVRDSSAATSS